VRREPANIWRLSQRASLSQGDIAFDTFGQGPPVVLVHGTPSWSYLWRQVVPGLSDRFTVYVFDLLGYGDSEPKGQDVSIATQARLLTEIIGLWDLEAPAIAGHDIGGAIVLRSHLLDEVRFSRIALIDAVVLRPWITPTTRHMQAHLDVYRTMPTHIYERVAAAHIGTAVHRPMDEATFERYFARWRGKDGQEAYLQKVAQFDEGYTAEFEPLLGSVQAPVRIIWGERDAWLDPAFARRLCELLPNSDLKLIPEAGHFVMEDAPEEATRELRDFFAADGGTVSVATREREHTNQGRHQSVRRDREDIVNYLEQPLADFLGSVASGEPAPSGGAVAAVAVALAAGLCSMAARLSVDHLPDAAELAERAERLRQSVAPLAQEDAIAYGRVLTAYRTPDDGDPNARRERIQRELSEAADVPLAIAETGAMVAETAAHLAREGNPNLRGDAVAAALLAEAGARAAAVLVEINTTAGGVEGDRLGRAEEFIARAAGAARGTVEGDG
jgi:pimeloyl-ACP methyl ester carboxylesterase/formiminotetrahydrofolate cyclodeaminase